MSSRAKEAQRDGPVRVLWVDTDRERASDVADRQGWDAAVGPDPAATVLDAVGADDSRPDALVLAPRDGSVAVDALTTAVEVAPRITVVACVPDAAAADCAFETGATEVVRVWCDGSVPVDLLSRRVRTVVDRTGPADGGGSELPDVVADADRSVGEFVKELLRIGHERLGVSTGVFARVGSDGGTADDWQVVAADGTEDVTNDRTTLPMAALRRAVAAEDGRVLDPDPGGNVEWVTCQRVVVDGDTYGAVCFLDRTGRDPLDEPERRFVDSLVGWVTTVVARRAIERDRQETRAELETTLERIDDGFITVDSSRKLTYINGAAAELLGVDTEAAIGRSAYEVFPETSGAEGFEAAHRAMVEQEPTTFDAYYDSAEAWIEVKLFPSEDGLSVFLIDQTGRRREERRLDGLLETARALTDLKTPEAVAERVVTAARDVLGFEVSSVRLHDPVTGTLQPTAATDARGAAIDVSDLPTLDDDEGLAGEAYQTGETVEYTRDPGISSATEGLVFPLGDHGTLSVATVGDTELDGPDRRIAEVLAESAVAGLDRADREVTLRKQGRRLHALNEAAELMQSVTDPEEVGTIAVRTVEEAFGLPRAVCFLETGDGTLESVAGDRADDGVGSLALGDPGYRAFETGNPLHRPDATGGNDLFVPVADHGLLGVDTQGAPAEELTDAVGILASHTAAALDRLDREHARRRRERRLDGLLDTTKALLSAGSRSAVASTVAAATDEVFDYERSSVYLYDEDDDRLRPVAVVGTGNDTASTPACDPGEGAVGEAFERDEPTVVDEMESVDRHDYGVVRSGMVVPLGDHGVLSASVDTPGAFDETDLSVAELLAENAAAAFDRAARERRLSRYETVLENVQDMVFTTDRDGRVTYLTPPLADWLGYDREAVLGRSVTEFYEEISVEAVYDRLIGESVTSVEYEMIDVLDSNGDRLPVEAELSALPATDGHGGLVGVVRDRSELERTREELQRERDRFASLFELLPDPANEVEFVDGDPVVRDVNPTFEEVFGFEDTEVRGCAYRELLSAPASEGTTVEADFGAETGESITAQLRRETVDGPRDFLFRAIPYREGENGVRAFGLYTDITDQRRLQRRLEVLNRVLRHNIRNSMTVVLGYAELLAEELVGEDGLESAAVDLHEAAREVAELSNTARELEALLRGDVGGTVDAAALAREVVADYDAVDDATIETGLPKRLPAAADSRLRSVFEQLVDNAITHVEVPHVIVTGRVVDGGDAVSVTVADDGPGLPDNERTVIDGDNDITQLEHGSGLGLWFVKWAVESYGGTVTFDETVSEGTAVTVTLPCPADPGSVRPARGSADD